ncbi:hypothetical protein KO361_00400 [Candidatus Woesearchaeota archaeon]|nr:hypothetical protein [Candidatus Woesearchaeota archaeon]
MFVNKQNSVVFVDLDETLFRTFAKVKVFKNGSLVRELSNKEYNSYVLGVGEVFDFSEFRDASFFRETSVPIPETLSLVKDLLKNVDVVNSKIVVLTAREDFQDKDTFLKTFYDHGIDVSDKDVFYVDRVGNIKSGESIAVRKKSRIISYLSSGLYRFCVLIDDDLANIDAFLDLANDVPNFVVDKVREVHGLDGDVPVGFLALHVQSDGSFKKIVK